MSTNRKNFFEDITSFKRDRSYVEGRGSSNFGLREIDYPSQDRKEVTIELSTAGAKLVSIVDNGIEILDSINDIEIEEVIRLGCGDMRIR